MLLLFLVVQWTLLFLGVASAFITDLKLTQCDTTQYACPHFPQYRRIPIDLLAGSPRQGALYLELKDDPAADPITGIQIVQGDAFALPKSWHRLETPLGNTDDDKETLWLLYTKDKAKNPVSSVLIKSGAHPSVAAEYLRLPVNLNPDGSDPLYLFYAQDGPFDPITAITAKECFTDDCYLEGWERVEKDLNEGILIGMRVFLFYQRVKGEPPVTDVAVIVNDQTPPEGYHKVQVDLNAVALRGASIHLWYKTSPEPTAEERESAVQSLAIEYGGPSVTPFGWEKIPVDLNSDNDEGSLGEPTFLFIRRGYTALPKMPPLTFNNNGTFKILQLADLHFTNDKGHCRDVAADFPCEGDATTIHQIERLLDLEKPDLVVFTGDNVDSDGGNGDVSDARAATFKFADPVIQRKIPWATIFGNHDDRNDLTREELYQVIHTMPYSVMERGPMSISGVGNYALQIQSSVDGKSKHAFSLYFLDSHGYVNGTTTEYDWLKQDQLDWLVETSNGYGPHKPNALLFLHIPFWEYHGERDPPKLGDQREQVSSPQKNNIRVMGALRKAGDIRATGCGHNHVNDYCMDQDGIFLCYGGGLGIGAYGAGHLGWARRARIWEISDDGHTIVTWKRLHDETCSMIEYQTLV